MIKLGKRGELTTQQIVLLIILILSFAVVLFFIFRLNLYNSTEEEICRNSVVARGSQVIPPESFPLECKRQYICITGDKTCEGMTKPEKYDVKTKEEVYQVLADEMADCWWMFGEGKVDYVKNDMKSKLYCSICSQIEFDDSLEKIFNGKTFDKREFYQYLSLKNISGQDQTYSEYLFGTKNIDSLIQSPSVSDFGKVDLTSQYYILMGISSDVSKGGWAVAGGSVIAGLLLTPITGGYSLVSVVGFVAVAGGASASAFFLAPVVEGLSGNEYVLPSLIKVNSNEFNDLNCEEIATLS
jgi:hypothetical protein